MQKWYETEGRSQETVVASRVRLLRNLKDYLFPVKLPEEEKKKQEVKAAQDELSRITEEKDQQYEAMKLRIKYMYEMGESDYLEILFSSGSLTDLFNQAEYISQISAYDRRMLEKYQQTVELVENSATALMQEQLQLENLQAEEQAKMASMQVLHDAKSKELSGIENMLADNEELREQYQQGLKNQEYTIEKLEQAMREEEERALQMALQASREAEAASIAASKSEAESISQSIEESIAQSIAQAQSSSGPGSGENQVDPDSREPLLQRPPRQLQILRRQSRPPRLLQEILLSSAAGREALFI